MSNILGLPVISGYSGQMLYKIEPPSCWDTSTYYKWSGAHIIMEVVLSPFTDFEEWIKE